ncbi:MAG: cytochrome-c peroxidase [Bacteroidetes bacterium]|nr:cytochrome-c peroxidase [Bacteroidota bacterium]
MLRSWVIITALLAVLWACSEEKKGIEKTLKEPQTEAELGELLFFDSLLSKNNQVSCASCHKPQYAFADNVAFSFGVDSTAGLRNTPSAMNLSGHSFFFHDGRAESLEQQASGPMENPIEMNMKVSDIVEKLNKHSQYSRFFRKIYGRPADKENLVKALAAYEETLLTSHTAFDDYMSDKDTTRFSESAKRGRIIFNEKAKCFDCHFGPDFTGDQFRNIGLFNGRDLNDSGRIAITHEPKDLGKFKVPGLRNVSVTGPYMHNGMFKTLREVIDYYDTPDKFVSHAQNRDTLLSKPLHLTEQDKTDLESFLKSLTDDRFLK